MESDYIWVTEKIMEIAQRHGQSRVVSVLEGGYDLSSLGRSVAAHIKVMAAL
jgi:acetoin utilization deacetylase AcuC-like enzyme